MQDKALGGGIEYKTLSPYHFMNFVERKINVKLKLNFRIFPMIKKYVEVCRTRTYLCQTYTLNILLEYDEVMMQCIRHNSCHCFLLKMLFAINKHINEILIT